MIVISLRKIRRVGTFGYDIFGSQSCSFIFIFIQFGFVRIT